MKKKIFSTLLIPFFILVLSTITENNIIYAQQQEPCCTELITSPTAANYSFVVWTDQEFIGEFLTDENGKYWYCTSGSNGLVNHYAQMLFDCSEEPCITRWVPCESGQEFIDGDCFCDGDKFNGSSQNDDKNSLKIQSTPQKFNLHQNYPNPFNPVTSIKFDIANESYVKLAVYDLSGKEITLLVNKTYVAGSYSVEFNASDLPSGIYLYKLQANEFESVKKMVFIK